MKGNKIFEPKRYDSKKKKKDKNKRKLPAGIYSGDKNQNFVDLMAQHMFLKYDHWDFYRFAMKQGNLRYVNKALKRIADLISQEYKLLV